MCLAFDGMTTGSCCSCCCRSLGERGEKKKGGREISRDDGTNADSECDASGPQGEKTQTGADVPLLGDLRRSES